MHATLSSSASSLSSIPLARQADGRTAAGVHPYHRGLTVVHEPTVLAVQAGLAEGRYEAGIVFASFAAAHAERFEVMEPIGTVCDAWIVYGREAVDEGRAVVWNGSPVARQFLERIGRSPKPGGS
ncbi:hypothetical protein SAMN05518800_6822 [Variovorax sp. YR752]|uniref:hypothetical protein n=1 Tax=Variovorax sp. YR752 TaxID=1884383 RepID=UPI000BDD0DD2|nr:hypothetical protein [Variovorax sp. YR752]SOE06196.1 hypothetical protein SAMN05518800_6822 [Variovorax sp. YR752]